MRPCFALVINEWDGFFLQLCYTIDSVFDMLVTFMSTTTMRSMVMTKGREHESWGEARSSIRAMEKREERLRSIFLQNSKIPDKTPEWVTLKVQDVTMNDIEFIRILGEIDTWQYLPEDVADILFKNMKGDPVRPQDFSDVSNSTIIGMSLRLMRLYLMGANKWNRKLIPKVMQVNRRKITRRKFMERVPHGIEMDNIIEKANDKGDYESDDNFDFDSVDFL